MNRTLLTLISLMLVLGACADDTASSLTNGGQTNGTRSPKTGNDNGDFEHNAMPGAPGTGEETVDPAEVRPAGSPELTSRLHGCGKLSVASIGRLLESRGLGGGGQRPDGTQSGQDMFDQNDTPSTLGAANYDGRVPEAPFASTSATSKMFDIFTMASYDAVDGNWAAPACPGVKVLDGGKFTKDGISCLIGKPATEEHVAIANDAIVKNPTDGARIAVAALLSAAHTCQ